MFARLAEQVTHNPRFYLYYFTIKKTNHRRAPGWLCQLSIGLYLSLSLSGENEPCV